MENRLIYVLMFTLLFVFAACETEEPEPITEPMPETEMTQPANTISSDIDMRLSQIDQEITTLEGRVGNMNPEMREEFDETLSKIQEEREDLVELQSEAALAESQDEVVEARLKMREEYSDIRDLLMEARLEAAGDMAELRNALDTEMNEIDREISEMEAEAADANAEMRQEYDEQVAELREQREALQQDIEQVEQSTEANWEETRRDIAEGWRDFSRSVGDALTPDPE